MLRAGLPLTWTVGQLPTGSAGAIATVRLVRALARRDALTPDIRRTAVQLTSACLPYDRGCEVESIFRYVRDHIRYVRDVQHAETVQSPLYTLETEAGDCDDKVGLLGALLSAVGYRVRYVLGRTVPARDWSHVYLEVDLGGRWVPLETTVPWARVGWLPRLYGPSRVVA